MMQRLIVLAAGLVLFSVSHSVLAAVRVRRRGERRLGSARAYRLAYSLAAVALLAATLVGTRGPWPVVWRAEGAARVALVGLQALAVAGIVVTVRGFDLGAFLGLRGDPARRAAPLQTGGAYRLCRHPLYFFTATLFSAWPTMDLRWLVVALWLWVYAAVGAVFEERKLLATFGDEYRRYRGTHWRLLPLGGWGRQARVAPAARAPRRAGGPS
jgi:protein-S-isoprenylcysteine O-methyltransferase Ste14